MCLFLGGSQLTGWWRGAWPSPWPLSYPWTLPISACRHLCIPKAQFLGASQPCSFSSFCKNVSVLGPEQEYNGEGVCLGSIPSIPLRPRSLPGGSPECCRMWPPNKTKPQLDRELGSRQWAVSCMRPSLRGMIGVLTVPAEGIWSVLPVVLFLGPSQEKGRWQILWVRGHSRPGCSLLCSLTPTGCL